MDKNLSKYFFKNIMTDTKNTEKYLISVIIRETKMKATVKNSCFFWMAKQRR